MIPDQEYIEQLMLEKLSGDIMPEDDHLLLQLMEKYPAVASRFHGLEQQLHHPDARQYLDNLDEAQLWEARGHLFKQTPVRTIRRRWLYRAAAVMLILLSGSISGYLFYLDRSAMPVAKNSQPAVEPRIVLQLASGETIDVSDTTQASLLQVGAAQMRLSPQGMQYEARASDTGTAMNRLQVPAGRDYKLTLSDSTEVWLNAMSEIRFPMAFNSRSREVFVSGEAYFTVKKESNRPFIVHTGQVSVNVLGTTFNVNTYTNTHPKISLASGKVSLQNTASQETVQLTPGYEATLNIPSGKGFQIGEFNPRNTLSWMEGKYYFKNSSLKEIAAVIKRLFDTNVVFNTPGVENVSITGVLVKKDGLMEFMDNLSKTTDVRYQLTDGVLHIL